MPALDLTKSTPELQAALARAQAAVGSVGKDGTNTQRGYRYATTEAMIRGSRQHLAAHGLAFLCSWSQALPEVAAGDIGKQHVAARVTIDWALAHEAGGQIVGTATMDAIGSPARPPDKAVAAAVTYGLGFVLRGILLLDRADEDEHAPDRRPEPEPDRLWMAYEAARAKAAAHLRVTEQQAHQRLLHLAEVREDPDMPDADVKRLIDVAEAVLLTDPAPSTSKPASAKAEPAPKAEPTSTKATTAKSKATPSAKTEPAELPAVQAARKAADNAHKAYKDTCHEEGVPERPWLDIAYHALGKAWDITKGSHGVEDYERLATAYEDEIDRVRKGEGAK